MFRFLQLTGPCGSQQNGSAVEDEEVGEGGVFMRVRDDSFEMLTLTVRTQK